MLYYERSVKDLFCSLAENKYGVWQLDSETRFIDLRGGLFQDDLRASGTSMPMLFEAYLDGWCHPGDVAALRDCLNRLRQTLEPVCLEQRLWSARDKAWARVHTLIQAYGAEDEYGFWASVHPAGSHEPVRYFLHTRRSEEELGRLLLDAAPCGLMLWDASARLVNCNANVTALFGLEDRQAVRDRFADLLPEHQPDGSRSVDALQDLVRLALTESPLHRSWLFRTAQGGSVPVAMSLARTRWRNQDLVAATVRVRGESVPSIPYGMPFGRQAVPAQEQERIMINMSHEIRTPLNGIQGMLRLLEKTALEPEQRRFLDSARQAAESLVRLMDDLRDVSEAGSATARLERKAFSLRTILDSVRKVLEPQAEAKKVALELELDPDLPDRLAGDPERLEPLLQRLGENAVKFTEQGTVTLQVRSETIDEHEAHLSFTVRDTGIGLSPKAAATVFDPFFQEDTSATRKHGGLGVGLAICSQLARIMGGTLHCESEPGQGSSFTFTCVFGLAPEQGMAQVSGESPDAGLAGLRVLLAEDNVINQMIAMDLLQAKQVLVDAAATGQEVLRALGRDDYDVVLMDIQMPEMDGLTAARIIRDNPKFADLPIIALTAHARESDRADSLEHGMNDHLTKPIDPERLYATLRRWGSGRVRHRT